MTTTIFLSYFDFVFSLLFTKLSYLVKICRENKESWFHCFVYKCGNFVIRSESIE